MNYRKALENPIPATYKDSWAILRWVECHGNYNRPEVCLNYEHVDFERVFLAVETEKVLVLLIIIWL